MEATDKIAKLGDVGIKNVDQRIKLHYGEDYGITIDSTLGSGTTIVIKIAKKITHLTNDL